MFFLELISTSCLEEVKEACQGFNNYEHPGDSWEITLPKLGSRTPRPWKVVWMCVCWGGDAKYFHS